MTAFGVHSEVGKLRKVIVHRPDLSLKRLTPANHDDLLFDDVLWVEQAQREHDAFVKLLRSRGVEVYLTQELLAETLTASDEARCKLVDAVASPYTVGWSVADEIRQYLMTLDPKDLAAHLIGGMTVAEADLDWAKSASVSLTAPPSTTRRPSSFRRFRIHSSRAIHRAGSSTASRSTRCIGRRAAGKHSTSSRSTDITRCSLRRISTGGTRNREKRVSLTCRTSAARPSKVEMSSRSATASVLIGMSERTQGRMIEQIARALFAKGSAERVVACVMGKDRAHMHLDTVFTMLDRDKVTAYPKVVNEIQRSQPASWQEGGRLPRHRRAGFPRYRSRCARREKADGRRNRRRPVPAGT